MLFFGTPEKQRLFLSDSFQKLFRLGQGFGLADVYQLESIGQATADTGFLTVLQVEIHDGEFPAPPLEIRKERRGDDMDAAEGVGPVAFGIVDEAFRFGLPGIFVDPSAEAVGVVKQQVAGCFPLACQ